MKYKGKYKNEPNRLEFWDYSSPGKYYITICTHDREKQFGEIRNKEMILSEYGKIVHEEILKIPQYNKRVILDEWILMPDHVHFIIELGDWNYNNNISVIGDSVGKNNDFTLHRNPNPTTDELKKYRAERRRMIIPKILGKFQMLTSKQINITRNTPRKTNWQHDYYDHIIRNYESYKRIKQYIIDNPKRWKEE